MLTPTGSVYPDQNGNLRTQSGLFLLGWPADSAGEIGKVRHIEASYLQSWLVSKAWGDWSTESQWLWRLSTKHGSNGVLGDVGMVNLGSP